MRVIIRTIADTCAEEAVNRYSPSRSAKCRRRQYRRYYRIVHAALHALAERLRHEGGSGTHLIVGR